MDIYERLVHFSQKGIACMLVTVVKKNGEGPANVGKKMLITASDEAYGTVGGGALEFQAREHCKELLKEQKNDLVEYVFSEGKIVENATTLPMACGGRATLFFEYTGVGAYVYIFGAGHVGQALAKVLRTLDYHLTVIDYRQDVLESFSDADRKVHQSFTEFIDEHGIKEGSYVIITTPSHKYDYEIMDKVLSLGLNPKYIGMLCSRNKKKHYIEQTHKTFGLGINLENFYAPIGLDTGGGSPSEIAISIAAEMVAVRYGKSGHKHMSGDD